jgi:hypothetical protein
MTVFTPSLKITVARPATGPHLAGPPTGQCQCPRHGPCPNVPSLIRTSGRSFQYGGTSLAIKSSSKQPGRRSTREAVVGFAQSQTTCDHKRGEPSEGLSSARRHRTDHCILIHYLYRSRRKPGSGAVYFTRQRSGLRNGRIVPHQSQPAPTRNRNRSLNRHLYSDTATLGHLEGTSYSV